MSEKFEIIGRVDLIETIAVGNRIREIRRLREMYGHGSWRKLKGLALVAFADGTIRPSSFTGMKHMGLAGGS